MDFAPTQQQQELCDQLSRFGRKELRGPLSQSADTDLELFDALWRRCAALDLFALLVPQRLGGAGHDALTAALALEALGRGSEDNGFLLSVAVQLVAATNPLVLFGDDAQQARWLGGLLDGQTIGAFCATEAEAGSDVLALGTTATPTDEGQVALEGVKLFVTNAPVADLFLVLALEPGQGAPLKRVSVYLVERDRPGLVVGPPLDKLGLHSSPMADVQLNGCVVPVENRLGPPGAGYTLFNTVMQWERTLLPAIYLGVMQTQLERVCSHARQRRQFGQPLADFQGVSHPLARMKARLESSRLLVQRAAWQLARGGADPTDAALGKLVASESFRDNSQQALQLYGAAGYMRELGIERQLRDAAAATLYSGTSEIQLTLIARLLQCPDA